MRPDKLFENGGIEIPCNLMSRSAIGERNGSTKPEKLNHSRSSSHDTIHISVDTTMKSSQSNGSLSDTSPTSGSPRPQQRQKPKAPHPPMSTPQITKQKLEMKHSAPSSVPKGIDTSNISFIDSDDVDESKSGPMRRAGSTENILGKPDRPPRPAVVNVECQTKATIRQVPLKDSSSFIARPVAAPRTTVGKSEFDKSEENLVTMREKPAIPDRPVTLMRPASFRAATGVNSPTSVLTNDKLVEELSASFANKSSATVRRNNSLREGRTSESNGNGSDALQSKQVTMYNIEKQQVSIIDVPPSNSPQPVRRQLFLNDAENKENSQNFKSSNDTLNSSDEHSSNVPASPRDAKIKRPQGPPPARPRSSTDQGDSTNL